MSTSFYKGLLFASLGLLFHAAYSAAEWRSYARKSEQVQSDSIPLDITLETVIGLSLAMVAVLKIGGSFKEIRSSVELSGKNWENVRNRPSFYIFGHRGRAFSPDYVGYVSTPNASPPVKRQSPTDIPEKFLS